MKNDVLEVNEISFRRVKNTGDYNSVAFEAKAMVIADDADVAADTLMEYVDSVIERTMNEKTTKKKVTKKKAKKVSSKKSTVKEDDASSEDANTVVASGESDTNKEETSNTISIDVVRFNLKEVWKLKGRNVADEVLKKFGVAKSAELTEEQYADVVAECERLLK